MATRRTHLSGKIARLGIELLFCLDVWAQQSRLSTIRGAATDPTGAAVPNVSITVKNVNTSLARFVTTNADGNYEIADLVSGTYRLSATSSGFTDFVAENIILESSQVRRIDVSLQIGATQTSVSVSANAAVIETEAGHVAVQFDDRRYEENPLTLNLFYPSQTLFTLSGVYNGRGGSV